MPQMELPILVGFAGEFKRSRLRAATTPTAMAWEIEARVGIVGSAETAIKSMRERGGFQLLAPRNALADNTPAAWRADRRRDR